VTSFRLISAAAWGREYAAGATLFGLPLLQHCLRGFRPAGTGKRRLRKGWWRGANVRPRRDRVSGGTAYGVLSSRRRGRVGQLRRPVRLGLFLASEVSDRRSCLGRINSLGGGLRICGMAAGGYCFRRRRLRVSVMASNAQDPAAKAFLPKPWAYEWSHVGTWPVSQSRW